MVWYLDQACRVLSTGGEITELLPPKILKIAILLI